MRVSRQARKHKRGDTALYLNCMPGEPQKTFYLETFGCQMNVHDSEKVVGTLISQGYRQVSTVDEAGLILTTPALFGTKPSRKSFIDNKKLQAQGKKFAVLGCVGGWPSLSHRRLFQRGGRPCGSRFWRDRAGDVHPSLRFC